MAMEATSPAIPSLPNVTTEEDFWSHFGTVEHIQLDFKLRPDGLADTVVSMANAEGGIVVVGVSDDRALRGVADPQRVLDKIDDEIHSAHLLVVPVVERRRISDREIVFVRVPRQLVGVAQTSGGRVLRRSGSRNRPLVGDALLAFIDAQRRTSGESEPLAAVTSDDFDLTAIATYLERRGTPRRVTRSNVTAVLAELHLAEGGVALTASILAFGRNPQAHLPRATLTFVRSPYPRGIRGKVRHTRREDLTGPIPRLIERAYDIVYEEMRKHSVVRGLLREETPEYPPPAVREAIVNALAHRDYRLMGSGVVITMYEDAIEVRSPGGLPAHVTVENIREEQFSRNPRIMDILQRLGFVEQLGSGMDTIFDEMERNLLQEPILEAASRSFTVVLAQQSLLSFDDKAWLLTLRDVDLTVEERKVLVMAKHQGTITNANVRGLLSRDREGALRLLRRVIDVGLLELVGERGSARYRLVPDVVGRVPVTIDEAQASAIVDHTRRTGQIRNADVRQLLGGLDVRQARALLQRLVRSGRLRQMGSKRGTYYVLPEPIERS